MAALLEKQETNIIKLRFWGKIFGLDRDYYVLEAHVETSDSFNLMNETEFLAYEEIHQNFNSTIEDFTSQLDSIGRGINRNVFFVSTGSDLFSTN